MVSGSTSSRRGATATTRPTAARRTRARRRRRPLRKGPSALAGGERELAAELDGEPELDVLVEEPVRLDLGRAPRAEPVADPVDELLGRRRAGGHPHDLDALDPRLVDLALVVDQVSGDAVRAR